MRVTFLLSVFLIIIVSIACNQASNHTDAGHLAGTDSAAITAVPIADTVKVISKEEAETVVAMHYSRLNREAKYLLYQGLLVAIDSIRGNSGDTMKIFSTIHGRKWPTPNGDTTTLPFKEIKALKTWRKDRQWNSD
jgi:ABC-type Fe3+-hydroxamate transport system substrate-binding protein